MRPMLVEIGASLAVKEATRPGEFLAHRAWPDHRGQRSSQRALKLRALHGTEPRTDQLCDPRNIRPRCRFPVVERLLPLLEHRPLQPSDADDPLELDEDFGHPIEARLVDPRLDSAFRPVRPALSIKETRRPRQVVRAHSRELDRTRASCLSSKRAKTSHKVSTASAIFDDTPRTNVRLV